MKRRNFLKGVAALFALPSLPVKALASVVQATLATATSSAASRSAVDVAYIWCRQFVENRADFTPNMLTQKLGFSEKIVEEVLARMVRNDVVRPTLIKGVFQKMDSPIDFIDRNKLKSALELKDKFTEFLEAEEMREEELADVVFIPNDDVARLQASTHAGLCAKQALA